MVETWSGVVDGLVRDGASASLSWGGVVLTTHFQPIYAVRRTGLAGYEALVRATDASGSPVAADRLFAAAAREGNALVLDRACRALHLRNFATVDPGEGRLYLNVIPDAAVEDAAAAPEFGSLIRYYGLVPRRVVIEVLEHPCLDENALVDAVAAYREIGAAIAMDDFGAGRSNFDRIGALRPEIVKLERSMLAAAMGDARAREQLRPLVEMIHDAGAQVLVEGIESVQEASVAVEAGASYLQGNYLCAPRAGVVGDDLAAKVVQRLHAMREPRVAVLGAD